MPRERNRQWRLVRRPGLTVGPENFEWTESAIPSPGPGEALVRNLFLSLEPTQLLTMRAEPTDDPNSGGMAIGEVVGGVAVSRVIESRHPQFRPGDLVYGFSTWEDYSVIDGRGYWPTAVVPPGVSPELAAGPLGITGMVAYFGMTEVAAPRAGETCLVSSAAGGVGSMAVQIGRLRGLRVIGIAGGRAKHDWLLHEAGIDGAIDHRSEEVGARLDALCPEGIDIYFDNTGGPLLDLALARLRRGGRVVVCGGTFHYAPTDATPGPTNYLQLCMMNGRMEGLLGKDYFPRFPEAIAQLRTWIDAGQIRPKLDVVEGLERAPEALGRLFTGENVGKQVLRIV